MENPTKEQVQEALTAARKSLTEAITQAINWKETERRCAERVIELEAKLLTFDWRPNAVMLKDFTRGFSMNAEKIDWQLRKGERVHAVRDLSELSMTAITRQDGQQFYLPAEFVQLDEEKDSTL